MQLVGFCGKLKASSVSHFLFWDNQIKKVLKGVNCSLMGNF